MYADGVLLILAQTLTEHSPASHAIWWVAGAIGLVLGVIVAVEIADWVRYKITSSRETRRIEQSPPGEGFRLEEPNTELRWRFFHRFSANPKKWTEGLIETDRKRRSH